MSVGSTTATCGQYIPDGTDLVGIMDGSNKEHDYSGYTVCSVVCSTFNRQPSGMQDGYAPPKNINKYVYIISGVHIYSNIGKHNVIVNDVNNSYNLDGTYTL